MFICTDRRYISQLKNMFGAQTNALEIRKGQLVDEWNILFNSSN